MLFLYSFRLILLDALGFFVRRRESDPEFSSKGNVAVMRSIPESLAVGIAVLTADGTICEENATWQALANVEFPYCSDPKVRPNYFDACTSEQVRDLRGVIEGRRKLFTCLQPRRSAIGPFLLVALPRGQEPPSPVILLQVNVASLLPIDATRDMVPEASFSDEPAFGIGLIVRTIEQTMQTVISKSAMDLKRIERAPTAGTAERSAVAEILQMLTPRQREVLKLLGTGKSNTEIAAVLCITTNTAKLHVAAILRRLDLSNRMQAVALGARIVGGRFS
jgi:DNA-binding NarL/FixJ family response regulator